VTALEARIRKDEALAARDGERPRLAGEAAAAYRSISDRTRRYYPAVNAATLTPVAGDVAGAQTLARHALVTTSVAPAGEEWVPRFRHCLEAAASVIYATEDAYLDDDVLFGYCAELAMGLALVRARYLDADVHQLALWDGRPPRASPEPRRTSPSGARPATTRSWSGRQRPPRRCSAQ